MGDLLAQPTNPIPVQVGGGKKFITLSNRIRVRYVTDDMKEEITALKFTPSEQLIFDEVIYFKNPYVLKYIKENPDDFFEFWKGYINNDGTDKLNFIFKDKELIYDRFLRKLLISLQTQLLEGAQRMLLKQGKPVKFEEMYVPVKEDAYIPEVKVEKKEKKEDKPSEEEAEAEEAEADAEAEAEDSENASSIGASAASANSQESEESAGTKKSYRKPTIKDSAAIIKEIKDAIKTNIIESTDPDKILERMLDGLSFKIKDSNELDKIVKKSRKEYKLLTTFNIQEKSIKLSEFLDTRYAKSDKDLVKFLNQLLSISLDSIKDKLIKEKFVAFFKKYTEKESYAFKQALSLKFAHGLKAENKE
jgi:hypothetical protein